MSQTIPTLPKGGRRHSRGSSVTGNAYIISDLNADLQSDIIEAFRLQFPSKALTVRVEPFVHTKERLMEILSHARSKRAAVCHVFMSAKLRKTIATFCNRHDLPCLDLVGAMFEFLSALKGHESTPPVLTLRQPGRVTRRASNVVAGYD